MVRHTLLKFQEFEVHAMGIIIHEYQGRGLEDVGAEAGGSFSYSHSITVGRFQLSAAVTMVGHGAVTGSRNLRFSKAHPFKKN